MRVPPIESAPLAARNSIKRFHSKVLFSGARLYAHLLELKLAPDLTEQIIFLR